MFSFSKEFKIGLLWSTMYVKERQEKIKCAAKAMLQNARFSYNSNSTPTQKAFRINIQHANMQCVLFFCKTVFDVLSFNHTFLHALHTSAMTVVEFHSALVKIQWVFTYNKHPLSIFSYHVRRFEVELLKAGYILTKQTFKRMV